MSVAHRRHLAKMLGLVQSMWGSSFSCFVQRTQARRRGGGGSTPEISYVGPEGPGADGRAGDEAIFDEVWRKKRRSSEGRNIKDIYTLERTKEVNKDIHYDFEQAAPQRNDGKTTGTRKSPNGDDISPIKREHVKLSVSHTFAVVTPRTASLHLETTLKKT